MYLLLQQWQSMSKQLSLKQYPWKVNYLEDCKMLMEKKKLDYLRVRELYVRYVDMKIWYNLFV